jgi:hypothetical protein
MKSNSATSVRNTNTSHPPLARNAQGHAIAMPDGAAWWSIKRETRGRPQVIKGPDGHPYRLALTATDADLAETFGPGTYRLDALDALGNVLDYVTTIEVPDDGADDDDDDDERAAARGASSDLRFALQTIVEMSRAQSESLRAISEAQADWLKGLANAKSLPRNAVYLAPPALPPPAEPEDDDDEDDELDDEDERNAAPMPPWMTAVQTAITPAVEAFVGKLMVRNTAPEPALSAPPPAPVTPNPMIHLAEINARLSGSERRFLADVLRSRNGEALTSELLARSVDDAVELVLAGMARARAGRAQARAVEANADLTKHVLAVAALLDAEQRAAVLALIPRLAPDRVEQLKGTLLAMSVEDAAAWLRENLPGLCAEVAA